VLAGTDCKFALSKTNVPPALSSGGGILTDVYKYTEKVGKKKFHNKEEMQALTIQINP
jgi:hypothetical protein